MVESLKVYCPEVAAHFSGGACLANMTAVEFYEVAEGCEFLKE